MQRIFYIILFVYVAIAGCEPKEAQETYHPEIAIYSLLEANKVATARIEYTQSISDTSAYGVLNVIGHEYRYSINPQLICHAANVALFEDDVLVDSLRFNATAQLYEGNNHKVSAGGHYRIEITVKGLPLIYATTTVPYPANILRLDTVTTKYDRSIRFWNKEFPFMHISLVFADQPNENNFYELTAGKWITVDSLISWHTTDQYSELYFKPNGLFENLTISYGTSKPYFSDKLFNGKTLSLKLEDWQYGQGFFIFPYDSLICFNLAKVSVEEAKYFKSVDRWAYNYNNAFAEPVPFYSNVVNGVGIFAAKAVSTGTIRLKKY